MSETAAARETLAPYCSEPIGIDFGFGGDKIVPHAWAFDMSQAYTSVGGDRQQVIAYADRPLQFLADGAMDWIYSSHLLEDFHYFELSSVLREWRRVLKSGGLLVTNCPDQQKFVAHCTAHMERTGQDIRNLAHKEADFSLETFRAVLNQTGAWEEVFVQPEAGAYSWYLVVRKVGA